MSTTRRELLAATLPKGDKEIVRRLIRLEQETAVAPFRDQALAHIRALGGKPRAGLGSRDRRQLLELELSTVAAYRDAIQRLEKSELVKTAAEIMANHGQRLVVLRQALGRDPVPVAFEPL